MKFNVWEKPGENLLSVEDPLLVSVIVEIFKCFYATESFTLPWIRILICFLSADVSFKLSLSTYFLKKHGLFAGRDLGTAVSVHMQWNIQFVLKCSWYRCVASLSHWEISVHQRYQPLCVTFTFKSLCKGLYTYIYIYVEIYIRNIYMKNLLFN